MTRRLVDKLVHWVTRDGEAVHQTTFGGLVTLISRPTGLSATVTGNAITLGWTPPDNWTKMRPVSYQLASNSTTSSIASSATSHVLSNLVPGDHVLRIRGRTVNGFTRWSNRVTATIQPPVSTDPLVIRAFDVRLVTRIIRAVIGHVSGGKEPVTVVASGLPDGMTFNADDLSISGASLSGTYPFTLTATDSSSPVVTKTDNATLTLFSDASPPDRVPIVVANDLTIERNKPVADIPLGSAFGGDGVLRVVVTGLPAGLTANVTNPDNITITGQTSDSRSSVEYRISATDMDVGPNAPSDTRFDTGTITLGVAFAPVITCVAKTIRRKEQISNVVIGTLTGNTVGTVVTATGLPTGLSARVVGGNIVMSGRTLSAPDAFSFTLKALAANGTMDTCSSTLTLQAALRPTLSLSNVTVRRNRVISIAAGTYTPGNLPLQRDLAVVVLPAGLRYTFDNGIVTLSGRTTAAAGTFTAQATIFDGDGDSQVPPVPATATITIRDPAPPAVSCGAALSIEANENFSGLVVGHLAGVYRPWSIDSVSGAPPGATYSVVGSQIRMSGIVGRRSIGSHQVTIRVADRDGVIGSVTCTLTVSGLLLPCTPTISASSTWNTIIGVATATTGATCGAVASWEFVSQVHDGVNWRGFGGLTAQVSNTYFNSAFVGQLTRYRIRVRAVNAAGNSAWSNWAETTTGRQPRAPGVPRLPACTMGPGNQVTVTCQPPTDLGTPAFHQWNIRWEEEFNYGGNTPADGGGTATIQGTGAVSHTVTLSRTETFSFFFSCTNTAGTGPEVYLECNADDLINLPCDGPFQGEVGAEFSAALSAASITASGRASGLRPGNISYDLRIPSGPRAPGGLTFNPATRVLSGTPLQAAFGYQMRYRASYTQGGGGFDVCEIQLDVTDQGVGVPAVILSNATKNSMHAAMSVGNNTHSLRWKFWEGGAADEPGGIGTAVTVDFNTTRTGLKKGTLYSARCWAFFSINAPNSLNLGVASPVSSLSTLDDLPPDRPRQPYCIPRTVVTELGFGWQPPQETETTEPPTSYEYQYRANSTGDWSTLVSGVSVTVREVTLTGLLEGTPYQIRVRGRNVKGPGDWTTFVCQTKTTEPPGAPRNLACDSHTKTTIRFIWDAPLVVEEGDVPHGSATGYQYRVDGGVWQESGITATGRRSSVVVTGLTPTSDVLFEVRAWNIRSGARQYGDVSSITCSTEVESELDITQDVNLFTFRVRKEAYYSLAEATGGRPPLSYSLTGALPPGIGFDGVTRRLGGTALAARDRTDHNYIVTDRDNETDFAVVGVRVIDVIPPPFELECKDRTGVSITVGWDDPVSTGSPITGYRWRHKRTADTVWGAWADLAATVREAMASGLFQLTSYDFEVEATNAVGTRTAAITCVTLRDEDRLPLTINDTPPICPEEPFVVGVFGTHVLPRASGGYDEEYTYEVTGTLMEQGFAYNPATHNIQGIALNAGSWTLTLTVTDASGATASVTCQAVISIVAIQPLSLPAVDNKTIDLGVPIDVTDDYWQLPVATGGEGDLTYSLVEATSGINLGTTAVIGIRFDAAARRISGTMTRRRSSTRDGVEYSFGLIDCDYTVTDSGSPPRTAVRQFLIYCNTDPDNINSGLFRWTQYFDIQDMVVGDPQYKEFPRLVGGQPPYTILRTNQVTHPGLTIDYDEGALVGTPTEPTPPVDGDTNDPPDRQYASFRGLVARDSTGTLANFWDPERTTDKTSGPTQWKVYPAGDIDTTFKLGDLEIPDLRINQPATIPMPIATGGEGEPRYEVTTTIPGMDYRSSNHTLTGVPTTLGTFTVLISAWDEADTNDSASTTVEVKTNVDENVWPLTWNVGGAPTLLVDQPDSIVLPRPYGGNPPYSYGVASGVPPGMFYSELIISGTPSRAGTYLFSVTAYDQSNPQQSVPASLSITVRGATTDSTPFGIVGSTPSIVVREQGYVNQLLAGTAGGTPPPIEEGLDGAPYWLRVSGRNLSGQAQGFGSYNMRRRVRDSGSPPQRDDETISMTVTRNPRRETPLRWRARAGNYSLPGYSGAAAGSTGRVYIGDVEGGTPLYSASATGDAIGAGAAGITVDATFIFPDGPTTLVLGVRINDSKGATISHTVNYTFSA